MTTAETAAPQPFSVQVQSSWPVLVGLGALVAPTIISLGQQFWSKDIGAHGPIIFATGLWLLWRQYPDLLRKGRPGALAIAAAIIAPSLLTYTFGRAYGFLMLEVGGLYGVVIGLLYSRFGPRAMLANWFPLLYLAFSIPPPTWVVDLMTASLKHFATDVSTGGLRAIGVPVAREGVTIFVAQYQLLVEDACSGMHSIIGLIAISLLYVYLMHGSSLRYSIIFAVLALPVAVVANILRICVLVLLTYFAGEEVAQGFLHFAAGIFMFAVALVLVFSLDQALMYVMSRRDRVK